MRVLRLIKINFFVYNHLFSEKNNVVNNISLLKRLHHVKLMPYEILRKKE